MKSIKEILYKKFFTQQKNKFKINFKFLILKDLRLMSILFYAVAFSKIIPNICINVDSDYVDCN